MQLLIEHMRHPEFSRDNVLPVLTALGKAASLASALLLDCLSSNDEKRVCNAISTLGSIAIDGSDEFKVLNRLIELGDTDLVSPDVVKANVPGAFGRSYVQVKLKSKTPKNVWEAAVLSLLRNRGSFSDKAKEVLAQQALSNKLGDLVSDELCYAQL